MSQALQRIDALIAIISQKCNNTELSNKAVVIDGSEMLKAGFSGSEAPTSVFPSIIGVPKDPNMKQRDFYVGDEAMSKKGILKLRYPMEHNNITNWNDMERVWHYALYNELRIEPSEHPILLTEAPGNTKSNRKKMIEIMFETFNVPSMYIAMQPVLSLYATGRTTGIVLDSGSGITYAAPIHEGRYMQHAVERVNFGGRDITKYLNKILDKYTFEKSSDLMIVKDIKEKLCYVAVNFDEELQKVRKCEDSSEFKNNYKLPDGQVLSIGSERFCASEALFKPDLIGLNIDDGFDKLINRSIKKCDINLRKEFYNNIVLSGGNTMFDGIVERLQKEFGKDIQTKIVAPHNRKYSVWIGASMLCSTSAFDENWITKKEYELSGSSIIHSI